MFNYLRLLFSRSFFESILTLSNFTSEKQYDILFYYPQHLFNKKDKSSFIFRNFLETVKKENKKYLLIEEPNIFLKKERNNDARPIDILWLITIILRKLFKGKNFTEIDNKIGSFYYKLFIKSKVRRVISTTQSFQSVLKGMFPDAIHYDYQHGLISSSCYGYIDGDKISNQIVFNNVKLLLFGNAFQQRLSALKSGNYIIKNSYVIGSTYKNYKSPKSQFNKKILFSLQFTPSHSHKKNNYLLEKTLQFFKEIDNSDLNVTIYLKSHPRFQDCIDISSLFHFNFIRIAPTNLNDCFNICSLHITEYSTVIFDSLVYGIPTVLSQFSDEFNCILEEYDFPIENDSIIKNIKKMESITHYQSVLSEQINWSKQLFSPFNREYFSSIINGDS
ncbi:MAG: hypothetical protein ACON4E_06105 [Flavobacteriales bacterium]